MENGIPDRAKLLFDRMPQLPTSIAAAYAQDGHVDGDPPPNAHKGLDIRENGGRPQDPAANVEMERFHLERDPLRLCGRYPLSWALRRAQLEPRSRGHCERNRASNSSRTSPAGCCQTIASCVMEAYAQTEQDIHLFHEATLDGGVRIDPVSFITILSACSHLGKIQIARDQWSPMIARTKTLGSSQRAMSGDHRARERHFPVDLVRAAGRPRLFSSIECATAT
ncbi:hypothetical protein SELMODRAFT_427320 [Selaginella moellendorffii]|uniref:Uncharacterized protein n=1 Tax=Selaginella moellendorffii TaxID=88036 RepID=D8SZK8_SELML|nr:hypothetical protein SELMODRAFT_427320 [Selaginella moellendorffii]